MISNRHSFTTMTESIAAGSHPSDAVAAEFDLVIVNPPFDSTLLTLTNTPWGRGKTCVVLLVLPLPMIEGQDAQNTDMEPSFLPLQEFNRSCFHVNRGSIGRWLSRRDNHATSVGCVSSDGLCVDPSFAMHWRSRCGVVLRSEFSRRNMMAIDKKQLGSAIKQVRNARGISQAELARMAGMSGSGNSVALIERGERFVSLDTLNSLAQALDIPSACLTILGSTQIGGGKEANAFMQSLKGLIASTLFAQAQLRVEDEGEKAKQTHVSDVGKDLAALGESLKRIQKKGGRKGTPLNKKIKRVASKKEVVHS